MKAPIEWLKQYVKIDLPPQALADRLTMAGLEVGAIEYHGKGISDVVAGKIKSIERHPKKPDVLICQVDTGVKMLQIVTKAQNVKVGDKVPVALHGGVLPSGIKIEKRELHGVESFGMLCSTVELGLSSSAEGILILDKNTAVGEDIKKVLGIGGAVLDIDVLPNRIDVLSVIGIAREIAAVLNRSLKLPSFKVKESGGQASREIEVSVKDHDLCPRYMARVIKNVKIGPSPKWLTERLLACGMRPINNVVDITNYVLLETGQPLHAFDLDLVRGKRIIVRRAVKGEKMRTLDGETREISGALVIADAEAPVAVAGVMGGATSEVNDRTRDILLESAYFDPRSIHRTEKQLKLRTESSVRFDRGVDWDTVPKALDRAAALVSELAGGEVLKGCVDVCPKQRKPRTVKLRVARVNSMLGTSLKAGQIKAILSRLGFKMIGGAVEIPLFRAGDVEREIDVIEEIARIYGYQNIPVTLPTLKIESMEVLSEKQLREIRQMMVDAGLYEANTYSMRPAEQGPDFDLSRAELVKLQNPISEELSVMRTSLIPSLLQALVHNLNRQIEDVNFFEIGRVYARTGKGKTEERTMLSAVLCGKRSYRYDGVKDEADLFGVKSLASGILEHLGADFEIGACDIGGFNPVRSATLCCAGRIIGAFGEVAPEWNDKAGVLKPVYALSLDINELLGVKKLPKLFREIAQHPATKRDIAMIVPDGVTHRDIMETIKAAGAALVENIVLFDMYRGSGIEKGHYSLAYSITYRDPSRTLTDPEVNGKHQQISDALAQKLGVTIRK